MATLLSVVSEHPAPMLRAGPLQSVLTGLLAKDPNRRATVEQARRELRAVLSARGPAPSAPPPQPQPAPPSQPPRPRTPVPGGSLERIDAEDLRALASASKELLGSVARDARDQARVMVDRRRERKERETSPAPQQVAAPPRRRRRFKRRWVVVPVVVTVTFVVLIVAGLALGLAALFGLL
jgi:hypothetical protein